MGRKDFRLLIFAALLCTAGIGAPAQLRNSNEGREIFAMRCATCHGLDGLGGERGPNIASRREVRQLSDQALASIVRKGIPETGMPAFRALGGAKLAAVVQHLRILQGRGAAAPMLGDAQRGRVLFSGKAGCAECHTVSGVGGFIGPDLSSYASSQPPEEIRKAITAPNRNLDPRYETVVVTTADGSTSRGIARNEDNFSLQLQTVDGAFHSFTKTELRSLEHQARSLMPDDYGSRLTRAEIDDVISYLARIARAHPEPKSRKNDN